MVSFSLISILASFILAVVVTGANVISPSNPNIWYHGRWDWGRGTWWAGTGFTLHVENLSSLSIQLGPNTTQPFVSVGISVDYGAFTQFNLTSGSAGNTIPLQNATNARPGTKSHSVIRLAVQGWENNNLYLDKIILNSGASLLPYTPSKLNFQLIGDSGGAGQYITNGITDAWPLLTAEAFKAEQQLNAAPGGCIADHPWCWSNPRGLSYQYFKTEDSGFYTNPKHNYTTDWDFSRDYRPTHIFLEAGLNDNYYNITGANFTTAYSNFIGKLRHLYPTQPMFIFGSSTRNPPYPENPFINNGTWSYDPSGAYETVLARHAVGDKKVYFIDTSGWVHFEDVISSSNLHFNPSGHARFAVKLGDWLKNWGLKPEKKWPTQVK